MLIPSDSNVKDIQKTEIVVNRAIGPEDPPPAYFDPQAPLPQLPTASSSSPSASQSYPVVPDNVKPTNFLSLSRSNNSVKGTYVIDPRIKVPLSLLPPLAEGESDATRRNMSLQTSNGQIDVEIYVVGNGDAKHKCALYLKSSNGSITAKLHAAPVGARPPINFHAHTSNGSVTLHLPLSFRGPLAIRTKYGSVRLAPSLASVTTTFSETDGTRQYFVGDFSDYATDEGASEGAGWLGDEVNLETMNGSIKVQYEAETNSEDLGGGRDKGIGKGLFGKLLGF